MNGSTIEVFVNGVTAGTTTVSGGTWSKSVSALSAANSLTAKQTESGKCVSLSSTSVIVGGSISGLTYSSPVTYCQNTLITANNPSITGTGTITYSGSLPSGLNLNSSTGQITGTPTSASSASNYLITANNGCNSTNFNVNIAVTAAPVITLHPTSPYSCEGTSVNYSVSTSASSPSYQWKYLNGASWDPVTGAAGVSNDNTNTMTINPVPTGYNGILLRCDVTSNGCSSSSNTATINVVTRPTGGSLNALSFCTAIGGGTVTVSGVSNATQYAWTIAPQLSGSSTTASISVTSSTPGTHSISVIPQNVVSGLTCNANSSISGNVSVTAVAGNETSYGAGSWIGYVYNSNSAGAFSTYMGYVTESETFNTSHTTPTGASTFHCSSNTDLFAIRYRMTKTFTAGYYSFTIGGDDGVRLSLDGGVTWHIGASGLPVNGQAWGDQAYTTYTSQSPIYLSGSVNLVFEYYENTGGAQTSFSYVCATMTPSAITGSATVCQQNSGLVYSVTNVANLTYNWTLPAGWSGSSSTNSITLTAGTSGGTLSVTATNGCGTTSAASSLALSTISAPTNVNAGYDVAVCSGGSTQLNAITGSASPYLFSTATGVSLESLASPDGTPIGSGSDDVASSVITIPFAFNFAGINYTQTSFSSNGLMTLGSTTVNTATQTSNDLTNTTPLPLFAPWWDDMHTGSNGNVRYKTIGSSPNRKFVVEWNFRTYSDESGNFTKTCQVWLFETSNIVQFVYGTGTSVTRTNGSQIGIASSNTSYQGINTTAHTSSTSTTNNGQTAWPGSGRSYLFSPITYSWSPATFLSATNVLNPSASNVTSSQTYTFTATANGCSNTDQVVVSLRTIPAATASNSGPVCAGGTVNLTASKLAPGGGGRTLTAASSQYLITPNLYTAGNFPNNSVTLEIWFKPTAAGVIVTELGTSTINSGWHDSQLEVLGTGEVKARVWNLTAVSLGNISFNTWNHAVLRYDAGTTTLQGFLNGIPSGVTVAARTAPFPTNGLYYAIGATETTNLGSGAYFNGEVDEFRVWNTAIPYNTIISWMNKEVDNTHDNYSNLIAYYKLNSASPLSDSKNSYTLVNSSSAPTTSTPNFYTYTWSGINAPSGTAETQVSGNTTGGDYTVVASSAGCSGTTSAATTVSVNNPSVSPAPATNDYVWTGAISTAWETPNNWLKWNGSNYVYDGVPSSGSNVFLPTVGGCVVNSSSIAASTFSVNNLNVAIGHTLTLGNAASTLNIAGTWTMNGSWGAPNASATVNFNGSGDQTIPPLSYSRLQTNTGGIKSLIGTTSVSGVVTIGASSTLNLQSYNLSLTASGSPITNSGTFTAGTSTVIFARSGTQTIPALVYYNLQTSGSSAKTLSGTTEIGGVLTIDNGTEFNLSSYNLGLTKAGSGIIVNNGTWTPSTGTVDFRTASNQEIPALTYYNLITNSLGTGGTKSIIANTLVTRKLTISAASILDLGAYDLNLSYVNATASNIFAMGSGGSIIGTGAINFSGAGAQGVTATTYPNVKFSGGNTKTLAANTTVNGLVTIDANTTLDLNSKTLTLSYNGLPIVKDPTGSITFTGSTVSYTGTNNNQLVYPATYNNLTIAGTSGTTKTLAGDVTVGGNIVLSQLLDMSGHSLTLNGNYFSNTTIANRLRSSNTNSSLILNCATATLALPNQISELKKLVLNSAGSTFTTASNLTINDELTLSEGALTLGANTLTFTGNTLGRTNGVINASNASSTMIFGANIAPLSIPSGLFTGDIAKLTMNRAGGVALGSATTVSNTLTLSDGVMTVGPNTFTMNGSTLTRTSGSIDASDASATLAFGNASLLTLPTSVFSADVNNLTLTGNRVKASTDFTVQGILNLNAVNPDATNGLLDLVQSYGNYGNTNSVNSTDSYNNLSSAVLTLGPSATVTGNADITGKVRRNSFVDGQTYAFTNKNMQLTFDLDGGVSLPSQITVVATKGTEGLHVDKDGTSDYTPGTADTLIGGAAVKRLWQVLKTGGSPEVKFDIRFPYEDSELNGNEEADLVTWDHHLPYAGRTPHEHGKTNVDATNNWVELSGHGIGYLATEGDVAFTKYWMLSENIIKVQTWLGAAQGGAAGDWYVASNWSKGVIPTVESILIPNASSTPNDPDPSKLPDFINLATIEIQPGGVLNGGSSEITLSGGPLINGGRGSWLNNGTFTPGTSKVIFDYTDATIAGSTTFNDIVVNNGKKVTIQANSNNTINGSITNNGTFDATSHANTVTYSGSGQSIIQPNGTTPGYHNLTIAQTSGTATAAANLNAKGSVLVSSGTFDLDNKTLNVKGDFTNNSTISNPGTVTLSGTSAQAIGGTSVTTFSDLTINGGSGTTTLNQNVNVGNILTVGTGKTLDATDKTILLTGSGTPFANSGSFTAGTSTVHYNNAGATNIAALTYNNLQSTGAATKTVLGDITVGETLTMNAGTLDLLDKTFAVKGLAMFGGSNIDAEDASVIFNNTSSLTLPANIFVSSVKNLTTNAGGNLTSAGNIALNGTLALTNGSLDMGSNVLTMEPTSTWTSAAGSLDATNASIVFKAATFAVGVLSSPIVKNLEWNRSSGISVDNDLEVTGQLTLTDGVVDISNKTLKLSGTTTPTATTGSIDSDNGTLHFNNSAAWVLPATLVSNSGLLKNMILSNGGGLELGQALKVSNSLSMSGGNIISADTKILEIGIDANQTGNISWTEGTVVGPMKRWFAASTNSTVESGIFPVGTSTLNRYAQINFTEAPEGGYLVMQFHTGAPAGLNYETDLPIMYMNSQGLRRYIQNADESGYWEMTPYNATGEAYEALDNFKYNLALRINNPTSVQNGGILNNPPGVKLIRAKGYADGSHGDWELAGTYSTFEELNAGADYVIKSVNVTGFSWFNGGGDNQNPLPIELLSFTGFCDNNQTTINWKTASEFNSSYFVVEKSTDGQNWREVNNQEAAGISTSELSYQFVDVSNNDDNAYYRLTQHDIDGEFTVYDPIFVSCNENGSFIKTYPNPSDNSFQVLVNNKALVGKATIQLIDTKGTLVSTKEIVVEDGTNLFYLNENMAPGIYYLSISNGTTSTEIVKHSVK
ncbi:MAG: T9SS type A sorting domain-containing protein [Flavobacteriales bacterium]|nr:T9SS type A sorting domain-containing protein [Flavobacteriales bacterium]